LGGRERSPRHTGDYGDQVGRAYRAGPGRLPRDDSQGPARQAGPTKRTRFREETGFVVARLRAAHQGRRMPRELWIRKKFDCNVLPFSGRTGGSGLSELACNTNVPFRSTSTLIVTTPANAS